jgi:hypothetical protein
LDTPTVLCCPLCHKRCSFLCLPQVRIHDFLVQQTMGMTLIVSPSEIRTMLDFATVAIHQSTPLVWNSRLVLMWIQTTQYCDWLLNNNPHSNHKRCTAGSQKRSNVSQRSCIVQMRSMSSRWPCGPCPSWAVGRQKENSSAFHVTCHQFFSKREGLFKRFLKHILWL